jgi:hypothetical protein
MVEVMLLIFHNSIAMEKKIHGGKIAKPQAYSL